MKKLAFLFVAIAAMAISFTTTTSCKSGSAKDSDSTVTPNDPEAAKPFEQKQLDAALKMHLDSIVSKLSTKQIASIDETIKAGKITLTADEKKVKPEYLLTPGNTENLPSAYAKYAALAILSIDKEIAGLYEMDTKAYDEAIAKLASAISDPAINKMASMSGSLTDKISALQKEMEEENRTNFFWTLSCAATVENLYIISQNAEKYLPSFTDAQIDAITFRLQCMIDAIDQLSAKYDTSIVGLAEAIDQLDDLNATTKAEFVKQLESSKQKLANARKSLLSE